MGKYEEGSSHVLIIYLEALRKMTRNLKVGGLLAKI
jgi:hypothetical protein